MIDREVMARFDHRDLNRDTPYFDKEPPTPENLARVIDPRCCARRCRRGCSTASACSRMPDTFVELIGPGTPRDRADAPLPLPGRARAAPPRALGRRQRADLRQVRQSRPDTGTTTGSRSPWRATSIPPRADRRARAARRPGRRARARPLRAQSAQRGPGVRGARAHRGEHRARDLCRARARDRRRAPGARLVRVRLEETRKNSFETGEAR